MGARGLPHVEIEIRQDLISDDAGRTNGPGASVAPCNPPNRFFWEKPDDFKLPGFSRCRNRGLPYS